MMRAASKFASRSFMLGNWSVGIGDIVGDIVHLTENRVAKAQR